jgi:hypothetical protein
MLYEGGVCASHIQGSAEIKNRLALMRLSTCLSSPGAFCGKIYENSLVRILFILIRLFDNLGLDAQLTPVRSYASTLVLSGVQSHLHKTYHI